MSHQENASGRPALIKLGVIMLALALSAALSLLAINRARNTVIDPSVQREMFTLISRDTWIEQDGSIDFSSMPPGVSSVEFYLNPWRPNKSGPPVVTITICGVAQNAFEVNPQTSKVQFKIPSPCELKQIQFKFSNTIPLPQSERRVGVQLKSVTYRYPFTWQLAQTTQYALSFGMLATLSLLVITFWPGLIALITGSVIVPIAGSALISCAQAKTWEQLVYLWLFATAISLAPIFRTKSSDNIENDPTKPLSNSLRLILLIVLLCGTLLRFYCVGFGLPDQYHPDEPRKGMIALHMILDGQYDPGYFLHPTLLLYLTAIFGKILNIFGLVDLDLTGMLYAGRCVSALAGSIAIYLIYLIGRRIYSTQIGILSAALLAFMPLHVTCSRYLKEDSLLTMFVLACTAAMLKGAYEKRSGWILLAGVFAGFATSSKYSGMLTAAILIAAPWLSSRRFVPDLSRVGATLAALVIAPFAFFCASPYVVLNSSMFIRQFNNEKMHMLVGHHKIIVDPWSQFWMYHFSNSVVPGMTFLAAIFATVGLGVLLLKWKIPGLFIVACVLLFYLPAEWVNAKPPPQPERYILPSIPFLCIAAAYLLSNLRQFNAHLAVLLSLGLVATVGFRSITLASEIPNDTRVRMRNWIYENVPNGSKFMIDAVPYSARIPKDRYPYKLIWTIPDRRAMTVEALKNSGYDYLLLTSLSYDRYFNIPNEDQVIRARFAEIFADLPLAVEMKSKYGAYGFHNPILRLYKLR